MFYVCDEANLTEKKTKTITTAAKAIQRDTGKRGGMKRGTDTLEDVVPARASSLLGVLCCLPGSLTNGRMTTRANADRQPFIPRTKPEKQTALEIF